LSFFSVISHISTHSTSAISSLSLLDALPISTVLFIMSAWSGLGRGIKYLSTSNLWLATALVVTLFLVGPSMYILNMFTTTIGKYAGNFIEMSFELKPVNAEKRQWINNWTIFRSEEHTSELQSRFDLVC